MAAKNAEIGVKRKHSITSFQKEWSKTWPCSQPVRRHPERALCTMCSSIAHQGKKDVQRHVQGTEHQRDC